MHTGECALKYQMYALFGALARPNQLVEISIIPYKMYVLYLCKILKNAKSGYKILYLAQQNIYNLSLEFLLSNFCYNIFTVADIHCLNIEGFENKKTKFWTDS